MIFCDARVCPIVPRVASNTYCRADFSARPKTAASRGLSPYIYPARLMKAGYLTITMPPGYTVIVAQGVLP